MRSYYRLYFLIYFLLNLLWNCPPGQLSTWNALSNSPVMTAWGSGQEECSRWFSLADSKGQGSYTSSPALWRPHRSLQPPPPSFVAGRGWGAEAKESRECAQEQSGCCWDVKWDEDGSMPTGCSDPELLLSPSTDLGVGEGASSLLGQRQQQKTQSSRTAAHLVGTHVLTYHALTHLP